MESNNRVVKDEETLRDRLPLGQFLDLVKSKIVHNWSVARNEELPNIKAWSFEPKVSLKDYTGAFKWKMKKKSIICKNGLYLVGVGENVINERDVSEF